MFRNIVTTYLARFAGMLATFLLLPIVSKAVGVETYGVYALVIALAVVFQQDLGMDNATTRFVAFGNAKDDMNRVRDVASASQAFYIILATAMSVAAALVFFMFWRSFNIPASLQLDGRVLAVIAVATIAAALGFAVYRQLLIGMGRLDLVNMVQIAQAVVRVAATCVVLQLGLGIIAVALVDFSVVILAGISTLILRNALFPDTKSSPLRARWPVFKEIFNVSFDLLILSVAAVAIMQAGSIVTSLVISVTAVAIYSVAQRTYTLAKEVTNSLSLAVLPAASSREATDGPAANARLYISGTQLANMLMIMVAAPLIVFMPTWLTAWVGHRLASAALAAQILVLSLVANNNHLLAIPILTAKGHIRPYAIMHGVWAFAGIVLSYAFGALWGVAGVALGIALPIVLLEPVYVWVVLRQIRVSPRQFASECLVRPYVVVSPLIAAMVLCGVALPVDLLLAVIVTAAWLITGAVIYYRFGIRAESKKWIVGALASLIRRPGSIGKRFRAH